MDELMMDWLYEELDPARSARVAEHAGGCARCSAELAALRRTREAFREMADVEPPPALSAILLHEAARRAPSSEAGAVVVAVRSDGDTGLWARIAAWLRPLALHPAATAACTVVLLAGVAGALYVRGGGELAAPTHMSSPDLPPPGDVSPAAAGPAEVEKNLSVDDDHAERPPGADPARARDGFASEEAPAAPPPSGFAAGVLDEEGEADLRAAQGEATASRARAAERTIDDAKERKETRSKRKVAERSRAQKGDLGQTLDEQGFRGADKPRAELAKDVSPRRDYAAPPATAPAGRAEETAAAPIATGGEAGGVRGPTRGAPSKIARPEPRRPATDDAAPEAVARPTAGVGSSAAPAETRSPAQLAWLTAQEGRITSLSRSGKCRQVAAVANDILDRDPSYYARRVKATVSAGKCQRLVGEEQRRRATRRASKNTGGSQRKVKAAADRSEAADAAEPAAEPEKAEKK